MGGFHLPLDAKILFAATACGVTGLGVMLSHVILDDTDSRNFSMDNDPNYDSTVTKQANHYHNNVVQRYFTMRARTVGNASVFNNQAKPN